MKHNIELKYTFQIEAPEGTSQDALDEMALAQHEFVLREVISKSDDVDFLMMMLSENKETFESVLEISDRCMVSEMPTISDLCKKALQRLQLIFP